MPENLPLHIYLIFLVAVFFSLGGLLYLVGQVSHRAMVQVAVGLTGWLALQAALSLNGFYLMTKTLPPRFLFAVGPPLLVIAGLFVLRRNALAQLPLGGLTRWHMVRVPVEITLWQLAQHKLVPQLMTFEGRNFDILAGLTAPLIYWLAWRAGTFRRGLLAVWNVLALGLLTNIVINAVLSLPYPMQQFGFDQPNRAVLYFPFIWLPALIVPTALFCHLASLWQLWASGEE